MTLSNSRRADDTSRVPSSARSRAGLIPVIGAFVLLASIYSVIVPAFETPDEIWHFAFIHHVATRRALPVSEPNTQALWRQQGVQAPAYYLAAAALTSRIDLRGFPQVYDRANPHAAIGRPDATINRNYLVHHANERWPWRGSFLALHVARFLSIALGAVTLWATYGALTLLVGPSTALLGTALFGFIPQFIFISAAASNDNAINALAALVLWRLVALVVGPSSPKSAHPSILAEPVSSAPKTSEHPERNAAIAESSRRMLPYPVAAPHPSTAPGALPRLRSGCSAPFSRVVAPNPAWPSTLQLVGLGCLLGLALLSKLSALGLIPLTGLALMIVAWRAPERRGLVPHDSGRARDADLAASPAPERRGLNPVEGGRARDADLAASPAPERRGLKPPAEAGESRPRPAGAGQRGVWAMRIAELVRMGLAVGIPALAIGGWWYVRNWILYRDPLAWNVWEANILLRVGEAGWRTIFNELTSLERSFWGLFGWLNVPYPAWVNAAFRVLEIGFVLGLLMLAVRWLLTLAQGRPFAVDWRWAGGGLLMLWLALLAISWVRFMRIAPAAQGRYFFPAAPSIALLMILGLEGYRLLRVSPRAIRSAGWTIAAGLALLSAITPFWIIGPAYQPPPPVQAAAVLPVRAELGAQFAILGVAAEPAQLAPGGTADVTVAWQALAPGPADYSVFIHLVDEEGLVVAQADTMPGGGLLPTSEWTPGQTRAERYTVSLPATAYTPNRGHWAVGLYDHRTGARLPVRLVNADPQLGAVVEEDALRFGVATVVAAPGEVPNRVRVDFQDNVTLEGYSLSSRSLRAGEPMTVTLYWRARGPVTGDYTTFAHLLDSAYRTFGGHDGVPQPPSKAWQPGQIITDTHAFTIAAEAQPGVYQVEASLYTRPDFDRLGLVQASGAEGADRVLLGPVRVVGPP